MTESIVGKRVFVGLDVFGYFHVYDASTPSKEKLFYLILMRKFIDSEKTDLDNRLSKISENNSILQYLTFDKPAYEKVYRALFKDDNPDKVEKYRLKINQAESKLIELENKNLDNTSLEEVLILVDDFVDGLGCNICESRGRLGITEITDQAEYIWD